MTIQNTTALQEFLRRGGFPELCDVASFEIDEQRFARICEDVRLQKPHYSREKTEARAAYRIVVMDKKAKIEAPPPDIPRGAEARPDTTNQTAGLHEADLIVALRRLFWGIVGSAGAITLLLLWLILATRAHGQPVPPSPGVSIVGQNSAGTTLFRRNAGQVIIKCGANFLTCSWTAGTQTFLINPGAGGGGSPGGSDNAAQYRVDAATFGGVTLNATATNKYMRQVSSGVPTFEQVDFSHLAGSLALAQTVLTTRGDILYVAVGPVMGRLGLGAATAGKYLKSDGTDAVISSGSASGTGACPGGQAATTLNADAAPTCTAFGSGTVTSVSGTANEVDSTGGASPVISLPTALTFTSKTVTNGTFTTPIISGYTVAGLPSAASNTNTVAVVTDATTAGSCTVGGGSATSFCRSNGAAWVPLGDGGGGGAGDIEAVGSCTTGSCFTSGSPSANLTFNNATSGTVTLQTVAGALGTVTASLPAETGTICTTGSVCSGYQASGSFAVTALSNLASVALNTALLPDAAAADDFGSATLPFKDLFFAGSSITPGTNNFKITGASTSGTRTVTAADGNSVTVIGDAGAANNFLTAISATTGAISKAQPAFTNISGALGATQLTGTSGGIPYFSAANTYGTSAALASGQFVLGGGAGATPTTSFSVVPIANGGTGTSGTLTGLVRGNASAMTAAELSGDATTSGSNAVTLAAKFKTIAKSISIFLPTTADTNKIQLYWPDAVTLQQVACSTDVGTATIQFDERAVATPNTAGVNSLTASLVCDTDTQTTTSFTDAGIAADVPHNLQITATASTPTVVRIHLRAGIN